ncbi:sigma-70 family RNA polymerase sigma factor [Streptococcus oricebi]|uniref:Transcriptional regulator n=1 Tax=Streptococcus oricebi TaxID=1547447 RepID=A0ABS5B5W4_9STRE|nr:sigma-70 family RNA polymerase sigma factor [Streptococcus oricebi]MBP2624096.1 transcriptional regulator [Streptococcus oricebi]
MDFKEVYAKVRCIVLKAYKDYYLHLWELGDWEQEGMMVLYQLIGHHPELLQDDSKLYRYYKTKFRNHIHDLIRKQESQKRRLNRQPYEEVSEIGHKLAIKELYLDELVLLRSALADYKASLSAEKQELYERLLANERFNGRQALLNDLKSKLADFNPRDS